MLFYGLVFCYYKTLCTMVLCLFYENPLWFWSRRVDPARSWWWSGRWQEMPLQKREKASPFFFFIDSVNPWYHWIYRCFIFAQKGAKEERESFAVSFLLLIHCSSVAFMDFLIVQVTLKTWTCLSFLFIFLLLLRVVGAFFVVILVFLIALWTCDYCALWIS